MLPESWFFPKCKYLQDTQTAIASHHDIDDAIAPTMLSHPASPIPATHLRAWHGINKKSIESQSAQCMLSPKH
jgi:hypothetical protein